MKSRNNIKVSGGTGVVLSLLTLQSLKANSKGNSKGLENRFRNALRPSDSGVASKTPYGVEISDTMAENRNELEI